jgi:hypothetical protein
MQTMISLDNVDNLYLTWQLSLGSSGASGSADFYNSYDVSITAPTGTVIVNNPGGSLFQTPAASVPEPNSSLLIGLGLLFTALFARRRFGAGRWWTGNPR